MSRFLLFFLFSFSLIACNNEKAKEEVPRLTPQYYYYPRANVYFDSANKEYLFMASDGQNWQTAKQIPAVVQGLMDKTSLVQNPSNPVWKDNEKHRLIYSAVLYATPNDTTAKKEAPKPIADRRGSRDKEKGDKKDRKGLGKFLDKIFGGLKKDKKKKDSAE